MNVRYNDDPRVVLTLDAGGTNLKFSAVRANKLLMEPVSTPSEAHSLPRCLENVYAGFARVRDLCGCEPAAISFAFPGPSDFPNGVIGDLLNMPAFRGGVPLAAMLEDRFGVPAYINNDGDLFAYGEAIAGFLPYVNSILEEAGSPKRYRNLFGLTLGTGLGGGVVIDGRLLTGDNSAAVEVWLSRHPFDCGMNAEEGASIRAVRHVYAERAGMAADHAPEPKVIHDIAMGLAEGNREAALEAFSRMGRVAGDVVAQALTIVDGLVVIGGGLSGAHPLFRPALVEAANGLYANAVRKPLRRLIPWVYDLEVAAQREAFLKMDVRLVPVPGGNRTVRYEKERATALGISRLGTSGAVAIGAYAYALSRLDE